MTAVALEPDAGSTRRERVDIDRMIDTLDVTDTVFHDLAYTAPLSQLLHDRILELDPAGPVALVGPNLALARSLVEVGYEPELWHVTDVALTEDLRGLVTRTGTVEEMLADAPSGRYELLVLPFAIEIAEADPSELLDVARRCLTEAGTLLVTARRAAALGNRIRLLVKGTTPLPHPTVVPPGHSWSWPSGAHRRLVDEASLVEWAGTAGLRVESCEPVMESRPVVEVLPLPILRWTKEQVAHRVKQRVPRVRTTLLASMRPIGDDGDTPFAASATEPPNVTVVVADDHDPVEPLLDDLGSQTHPADRLDVVVVHRRDEPSTNGRATRRPFPVRHVVDARPFGPDVVDRVVAECDGDVIALATSNCRLPAGWIEHGIAPLDARTAAVTGRIRLGGGTTSSFLSLPGRREKRRGDGLVAGTGTFYRRDALTAVGGFAAPADDGDPVWGWENIAADRLRGVGLGVVESPDLVTFVHFPDPADRSWIAAERAYAAGIPAAVRDRPWLRRTALHRRVFASERCLAFDLAVVGVAGALARRQLRWAVLGSLLWMRELSADVVVWPPAEWRTGVRQLRGITLRHGVWLVGLVQGSVRARTLVL